MEVFASANLIRMLGSPQGQRSKWQAHMNNSWANELSCEVPPRVSSQYQTGGIVREETCIIKALNGDHSRFKPLVDHKEVIDIVMAGRKSGGDNDAIYNVQPARCSKLLRSYVPVSSYQPGTPQAPNACCCLGKNKSVRLGQALAVLEPDGAAVDPALAHPT